MTLRQCFRKIRYLLDLKQYELAEMLEVSPTVINLYENGKRVPNRATLIKIDALIKQRSLESQINITEFLE